MCLCVCTECHRIKLNVVVKYLYNNMTIIGINYKHTIMKYNIYNRKIINKSILTWTLKAEMWVEWVRLDFSRVNTLRMRTWDVYSRKRQISMFIMYVVCQNDFQFCLRQRLRYSRNRAGTDPFVGCDETFYILLDVTVSLVH